MPALPNVPGVLRCDLSWTIAEDTNALTRLHISYTGTAPTDAVCATLAGDLYTIFAAELLVYAHTDMTLDAVKLTDLTTPTSGQGEHLGSTAGSLAGSTLGAATCFLASQKIARRYRGGKPRSYLPLGVSEQLLDAQQWTSAFVTNVQAALDAVVSDIGTTSASGTDLGSLVSVSYYHGFVVETNPVTGRARNIPILRTGGPVVDTVTAYVAEQRLSSQRRRNLR